MTRDRLKQAESLVCELEEERERFAREARRRKRIEETYGVSCLFGEQAIMRGNGLTGSRHSARTRETPCGSGSTAFPTP